MASIFISYRRDDSQGFAGRLDDDLSERFGDAQVFRDREIPAGSDFARHLEDRLNAAEVVLVVIGRGWIDQRDAEGRLRLDSPDDWVRMEIERALARDVPIVPVLVGGAAMPWPDQLPDSLAPLAGRQAFSVSDQRWSEDIDALAMQLSRVSPELTRQLKSRSGNGERDLFDVLRERVNDAARAAANGEHGGNGGFARWAAGRLGKLFGATVSLAVIYILVRALGGNEVNRMMDRVIATTVEQIKALF
jgi:hypothetical protein